MLEVGHLEAMTIAEARSAGAKNLTISLLGVLLG